MKYIINEDRLREMFFKYMDSVYGNITYDYRNKEFSDNLGNKLGYTFNSKKFYYQTYALQYTFYQMFGKDADRFMLEYLTKKFPKLNLNEVENYRP